MGVMASTQLGNTECSRWVLKVPLQKIFPAKTNTAIQCNTYQQSLKFVGDFFPQPALFFFSGFDTISWQKCGDHPLRGGTYHHLQMTTSPWVKKIPVLMETFEELRIIFLTFLANLSRASPMPCWQIMVGQIF